jgi:uncharacterized protein (TIRG00374 family)
VNGGRGRPSWWLVAGTLVGAAMLFIAIRQVDWSAVGRAITGVSTTWVLAAMLATGLAQALFAFRWYVIVGRVHRMTFADSFDFLAIGALAGLVLPPRLSDVARAVAASRYHATSATELLGTIVIERLLDVLMLVGFGALVSALMDVPPAVTGSLLTLFGIVALASVLLWIGNRGPLGLIARWVVNLRRPGSRLAEMSDRFFAGTGVIRERAMMPQALAITLAAWISAALAATATMRAFDVAAPWYAGAFTIVIINLAGILPAPPAGIGVYHYAAMVGVSPWLPDTSRGFAFALISHALSVGMVLLIGTWSLARKGLSVRALRRMARERAGEVT